MTKIVHKQARFVLVGDHPHAGESCNMVGESKDTITKLGDMYLVHLINCVHGSDECYAERKHLKMEQKP